MLNLNGQPSVCTGSHGLHYAVLVGKNKVLSSYSVASTVTKMTHLHNHFFNNHNYYVTINSDLISQFPTLEVLRYTDNKMQNN